MVTTCAQAAEPALAWSIRAIAAPSNFQATDQPSSQCPVEGECGDHYTLLLTNVGSVASSGPITLTDTLPPGLTTSRTPTSFPGEFGEAWNCTPGAGNSVISCSLTSSVPAFISPSQITLYVDVAPAIVGPVTNHVSVSGGGGPEVTATSQTPISSQPPPFGVLDPGATALDPAGGLDTRAAGHPAALDASFAFPTELGPNSANVLGIVPVEQARQIIVDLPAGLVGNPQAASTCSLADMSSQPPTCPPASLVGILQLVGGPGGGGVETNLRIYNVQPEPGHPAEFGVYVPEFQRYVMMYASVRPWPDYGVRVTTQPLPTVFQVNGIVATFFGNPARQDESLSASPLAFFTNPSDCSASGFATTVHVDSWQHPGRLNQDGSPDFSDPNWNAASSESPPVEGCDALQFNPSLSVQPDTTKPDSPTALMVDLRIPQNEDPDGLATPPLKDATVALPRGIVLSPSAADGLQGCSDEQIALSSLDPGTCPLASQIATVTVHTPILKEPLEGQVFLGMPSCSPCTSADAESGRLVRLFIQVQGAGVVLKIAGSTSVDSTTGQITATFKNNPQQPFDDLKLQFKEGPRAALATPSACGTYTTTSDLVPRSSPVTPDATPSSSFEVAGCGNPNLFTPSFVAGTLNPQAAAYSSFTLSLSRQDTDQQFSGLSVTLPPGLLAKLAGTPLCSDADANAASCPAASQVGSVTTGAGPGSHPLFLPGEVFLTGPYKGGPYGLVVEVPAVAGPFNLGTVVVRQSLRIDPHTAQATAISDPFPTILDGIPLQIRTVSVTVDRPQFTFNPTSCQPMQVSGALTSLGGLSVPVSSRFQATNCGTLPFKPSFSATTQGNGSRNHSTGASLTVKVASKQGPSSALTTPNEANIAKVDVSLPLALPSRLTTLQKACTEGQFAANPAGCPSASNVGTAVAKTPLLPLPLAGPAYLVSHGGAAFPDLDIILQGNGVTIDLVGNTQIKKGITFSKFETIPDAPISSFELKLPEGPFSALAANRNLCKSAKTVMVSKRITKLVHGHVRHVTVKVRRVVAEPLLMPTRITGQNGAQVSQSTKIAVTGCKQATPKKKSKAKTKRKGR